MGQALSKWQLHIHPCTRDIPVEGSSQPLRIFALKETGQKTSKKAAAEIWNMILAAQTRDNSRCGVGSGKRDVYRFERFLGGRHHAACFT